MMKDGIYKIKLNTDGEIWECGCEKVLYHPGKIYDLKVENGLYYIFDDFHNEEQISYNFDIIKYFDVEKV